MEIARLTRALTDPGAYPHPADEVEVHHTHISVVFLAGDFAYKVKKPVELGFLDFTTLEKRRHFCRQEVRLNRRLAPGVYHGVVPVVRTGDEPPRIGPADRRLREGEEVVEYAVRMERLPREATLLARLEEDCLEAEEVHRVARRIARFHRGAETGPEIARYGRWEVVARNARENFEQSAEHVGRTVSSEVFRRAHERTERQLERLRGLIGRRATEGVIRDTHGDLHLEHVYFFPDREPPRDLIVVDCIEFNERFRYADPVSDAAFLAMDLRFRDRRELARRFSEAYLGAAEDPEGRKLLPLYTAYRAAVRAKVEGMTAVDPEVPEDQREAARKRARAYWLLTLGRLEPPGRRPCLVLVGGLPGTGKSTLARALAGRAGLRVISSDRVRKELAGVEPNRPRGAGFGEGIYTEEWNDRAYRACRRRAAQALRRGERVAVDASFRSEERRIRFLDLAREHGVPGLFLLCEAEPETVRDRMRARARQRRDPEGADVVSDADWSVYREAAARWEEPGTEVLRHLRTVSTEDEREASVERALGRLRAEGLFR